MDPADPYPNPDPQHWKVVSRVGNQKTPPLIGGEKKAKPNPLILIVEHSYDVSSPFNRNVELTRPSLRTRCYLCYLPLAGGQVAGCP